MTVGKSTETKGTQTDQRTLDAWVELWGFVNDSIGFGESSIEFDRFFEKGKNRFDIFPKKEDQPE